MVAEFVEMYAGQIITIGGSLCAALIGAGAMVRARRATPGREPVPLRDIWEENRLTRKEADAARDENLALERREINQGMALVVMWRYVGRLIDSWGSPAMPKLTRGERAAIERVVEDISTPPEGTALGNQS